MPSGRASVNPARMTVTVRDARREDLPNLIAWNAAMAWETEHKRLDPETGLALIAP